MSTGESDRNRVRPAVKALIVRDGRLLATVNDDAEGDWYLLPGGGMEFGESMHEALQRECLEEIGCRVEIGDVVMLRDYLGARHELAETDSDFQQLEIYFDCRLPDGVEPQVGSGVDENQSGVVWLDLADLPDRLYPRALRGWLLADPASRPRYLGTVN